MNIASAQPVRQFRWAPGLGKIWRILGGVSIRTKILGIVLALTVLLGLGVTWQVRAVMSDVFRAELENRGMSVASDLAARSVEPILLNDVYALYQLLDHTIEHNPDALYSFVTNGEGQVLAHTFPDDQFPIHLLDSEVTALAAIQEDSAVTHFAYRSNLGNVHEFTVPVASIDGTVVRLGLTETRLNGIVNAVTGQMLLTTLVVALFGIAAAMFLTWLLTRPILELVATTSQVGQGNLSVKAPHWADDEIGALADAFNQMVRELASNQRILAEKDVTRSRLLEQLINAQEEERKRIARELHDDVGQSLTSLILGLKLICQMEDADTMASRSEELRRHTTKMLDEVRLLSRQLRPSVLDDLGLTAALERYVDEFGHLYPSIEVDLHCELSRRLPPVVETALYRIVQEAMTNAARHSGADAVSVLVLQRDREVQTIIEDNGTGFDPMAARRSGQSVGIHGMTERAELVGGRLDIESGTEGTSVYVEVPL